MSVITKFEIFTVTSYIVISLMSGISDSVTSIWTGLGPICRCDARGTNLEMRCSLQGKMMILDPACTWFEISVQTILIPLVCAIYSLESSQMSKIH